MISKAMITMERVRYSYGDGTLALQDLSLTVHAGESLAVVGANGAGKSTFLLHLNGYLSPQQGKITIAGVKLSKNTLTEIRKKVGMVFQDSDDQVFMPKVFDDVAFGLLNLGLSPDEVEQRVQEALQRVQAEHLRDRPPYRLSGGEKKAVAMAGVLAMEPEVLVMDEPTASLDPKARRSLINLLVGFPQTQIIASHDLDMVLDVCERTIVLHQGQIMADGPSLDIFQDKALLATCHLEPPLRLQGCPVCTPLQ